MAKSASPIRLQADLMQAATVAGKRLHRSTAEQIEYWADMGRRIATVLDPDDLLSVASGLAKINIEPVYAKPVNPDEIFDALEEDRRAGSLYQIINSRTVRYQVSESHPGYLEQINPDGEMTTGKFDNGEFLPLSDQLK
jgi:hypothetical protein